MDNVLKALELLWKGMGSVLIAMVLICIATMILVKLTQPKNKD